MTIIQLLESVGIENVRVEYLHEMATGATYRPKQKVTEFRMLSCKGTVNDLLPGSRNVGMMVWMPREKFEAACKTHAALTPLPGAKG